MRGVGLRRAGAPLALRRGAGEVPPRAGWDPRLFPGGGVLTRDSRLAPLLCDSIPQFPTGPRRLSNLPWSTVGTRSSELLGGVGFSYFGGWGAEQCLGALGRVKLPPHQQEHWCRGAGALGWRLGRLTWAEWCPQPSGDSPSVSSGPSSWEELQPPLPGTLLCGAQSGQTRHQATVQGHSRASLQWDPAHTRQSGAVRA